MNINDFIKIMDWSAIILPNNEPLFYLCSICSTVLLKQKNVLAEVNFVNEKLNKADSCILVKK